MNKSKRTTISFTVLVYQIHRTQCRLSGIQLVIQWKPLIMITLGPALFDNNNRLITLSGGFKNLHYLTQFIVTTFYMCKKQQNLF